MALFGILRNEICSRGPLWSIQLKKQLPVTSNVMLHLSTRQSVLKQNSNSIETFEKHKRNTCMYRYFSTSKPLNAAGMNHGHVWTFERILSLSLLGLIPSIFFFNSQELEAAMATCVSLHGYLGMNSIISDYAITKNIIVNIVVKGIFILISAIMLFGLLNIIYNDVGLAELLRLMWKIKGKEEDGGK